jgi:hypothetical protein
VLLTNFIIPNFKPNNKIYLTMKNFVKENWYKLMIGSSLFIFSVGFFITSVSPVYSSNTDKNNNSIKVLPNNQRVIQVPVNEDGSVNVKLSDEQIKEIKSNFQYEVVGCGDGIYRRRGENDFERVGP